MAVLSFCLFLLTAHTGLKQFAISTVLTYISRQYTYQSALLVYARAYYQIPSSIPSTVMQNRSALEFGCTLCPIVFIESRL